MNVKRLRVFFIYLQSICSIYGNPGKGRFMSSVRINEKKKNNNSKYKKETINRKHSRLADRNTGFGKKKHFGKKKQKKSFSPLCVTAAVLAAALLITAPIAAWGEGQINLPVSRQEDPRGKDPRQPVLEPSLQSFEDLSPDPLEDLAREAVSAKNKSGTGQSGEEEITVHLASEPGAPVPFDVMDTDTASLLKLISEGLVTLNENGEAAPGCAKKWSVSDDGLTWKFTLRRDLCWSDGKAITARDFEKLFKKVADPAQEILYGQDLCKNIAGYDKVLEGDTDALEVRAKDDRTLVFHLASPDPAFARNCASWTLLPVRELLGEEQKLTWDTVTGNGPYVISSCTPGQEYVLKRNPYYRQDQKNTSVSLKGDVNTHLDDELFDTVRWKVSGDVNEEYSDFLNGDIDAVAQLPVETHPSGEIAVFYREQAVPDMLGMLFNCDHKALKDSRVRRALSAATDRGRISTEILGGTYQPTDDFTDLLGDAGESAAAGARGDQGLKEAVKLLREAGYKTGLQDQADSKKGKDFPVLTCMAQEDSTSSAIAQFLAAEWGKLGIEVKVETADARHIAKAKEKGKYDILCGSLFVASDLPSAEFERFSSDSSENNCGFESGDYDKKLEKARKAHGEESYADRLEDAAGILTEEIPASPLAMRSVSWIHDASKADIRCDASGCWQIRKSRQAARTDQGESLSGKNAEKAPSSASGTSSAQAAGDGQQKDKNSSRIMNMTEAAVPDYSGQNLSAGIKSSEDRQKSWLADIRQFAAYYDRTDCTAHLTRQAYVLDAAADDAVRLVSLPKYSAVHLTGTGNAGYVRIEVDGLIRYMESDCVTADETVLRRIKAEESRQAVRDEFLMKPVHLVKESELSRRAADVHEETERILAEIAFQEMLRTQTRNPDWDGPVLSRSNGSVKGPNGKETYYNLNMNGVVNIMRRMGNTDEYWVRDDGCKMLGNYIMCAANLGVHPRGSLVESSLGTCIVCDAGGFASGNSNQLDIAVTW